MNNEVMMEVTKLMKCFDKAFINANQEVILDNKTNLYFNLKGIEDPVEVKYKTLEWVSRSCMKGVSLYKQKQYRKAMNKYFGKEITVVEWHYIYTYLGNNCNRTLCEKYVEADLDIQILKEHESTKNNGETIEEWYNKYH